MSRTYRALTTLALSLALAATTTAVAVAAEDPSSQREALYQSELDHNLAAAAARTQAAVEQVRAGERASAAQPAAPIGDSSSQRKALYQSQLDHNLAVAAARTQTAVEQARAGERNLVPVVTIAAPQPIPAAPGRDVDLVAIALLGLVGGLIGGGAVVAGAAASRRRHRVVAA